MRKQDTRAGILLMIATTVVFAIQDAMSRHLSETYNVWMVVMIRYWFFGTFALVLAGRQAGGLRRAAATAFPVLQVLRGLLLASEIYVMLLAFISLGLIEAHAVFACNPLIIAALSGPILGEGVGWRRWTAIGVGFAGVLIILRPGFGVFDPRALFAFASASMFALYSLLTRYVSRQDSGSSSFLWAGVVGAALTTAVGLWFWEPMTVPDWGWMALLCVCAALAHWLLIRCYELAEASAVQPFAYFQLVFASIVGITLFNDTLRTNVAIGAAVVVSAGVFTLIRERIRGRAALQAARPG